MTRNVRALNRAQKLNLIKLTMLALQAKLYYLQENYNTYHENYSNEAMQLYNASFRFDSAVNNIIQSEGMDCLDDNGLTAMAELSLQVSELYKLGVRTPDDQKEYEATIKQFKEDVYTEALKRLEANKTETGVYENKLISEIGNKDGKNLKGVYEYFDIQKHMTENENKISYAEMTGNNQDYTTYCAKQKEFKRRKEILRQNTPLIAHIYSEETLEKDIRNLCNKIRKAQVKVEKLLNKGKYPIWELNPVIAYIFETNEFYTPDKQEYIFDWIKEQERIDQLVDVFKNAIPIALSVMCFFMPGGVSIAMLILQGANAIAGAAAAYDDIQDAGALRNMAYSQYTVSSEAQKIIDNADLSAIERNYAMAILSGAFTMLDFAECIKIARKLGIGDEVMKYFAQGRKFRLSVDETEELVRKAGKLFPLKNDIIKYAESIDSWDKFASKACEIGKNTELSNKQKVELLQQLYESSPFKVDINIPSDVRYIKGFDDAGGVIYDWPKCLGFDKRTIKPIGSNNPLPDKWDRYGHLGGNNFSDIPITGKYTYSQRAIPYIENSQAYHSGVFNTKSYCSKIDCIRNNKRDKLNKILKKENIGIVNKEYFKQLRNQYHDYISDIYDEIGKDFVAPYGVTGYANKWKTMTGGAYQVLTPLNGITMKRLGILK